MKPKTENNTWFTVNPCDIESCEHKDIAHYHRANGTEVKIPNIKQIITAFCILLCNTVAVISQFSFFHANLPHWGVFGALLFAGALESIAIFLALMAHDALLSDDASLKLRLGSYAVGLTIGAINYSHFAIDLRPNVEAVSVGLLSAASAPMWGIYSRRMSRSKLLETGAIEGHSIRLGSARWTFHPVKCVQVMSAAVWNYPNVTPLEAIRRWEQSKDVVVIAGDDEPRYCKGGCGTQLPPGYKLSYIRGHGGGCPPSLDQELADALEHTNGDSPKSTGRV